MKNKARIQTERAFGIADWKYALTPQWITRLLAYFGPLVVGLGGYMLASQRVFGSFMPVSGQIKRWWGTLPSPIYGRPITDLAGLLGFGQRSGPWQLAINVLRGPTAQGESVLAQAVGWLWRACCW